MILPLRCLLALIAICVAGCARVPVPAPVEKEAALPRTRAEISNYTESSSYADVRTFLDSLGALQAALALGALGTSAGGREIPYAIASRPLVRTPGEARRLQRPIVYVQANIHGGEVEGKEALLMLLRDLTFEQRPNALDSIVLIAIPIYNVDGNEALGPQETNRPEQNGPAIVGRRPNAGGLDLNRDYIKLEAPETRASLAMFRAWNPDVFVDLHTTNGSLHGYALTYAPPLTPGSRLEQHTRSQWLSVLRERMRTRHGFEVFDYGNFGTDDTPWPNRLIYSPAVHAWSTFDHRPRFSTNYHGLRNCVALLSEAFSHDPFARRVAVTSAFVREILSLAGERASAVRALRHAVASDGGATGSIPIRGRFTTAPVVSPVLVEDVELTGDSSRTEPGLTPGVRRTGRFRAVPMPLYDRFEGTAHVSAPLSYVVPERLTEMISMLELHGVPMTRASVQNPHARLEEFVIDSVARSPRPFERHRETRVFGRWTASQEPVSTSDRVVPVSGSLAALVAYLLDPESDDGLVTWNFLDEYLKPAGPFPVRRLRAPGQRLLR